MLSRLNYRDPRSIPAGRSRRSCRCGEPSARAATRNYFVDTGLIAANVYLFAASVGLAAWFHNCDRSGLSAKLNLRADQCVLFGQTVGYTVKKRQRGTRCKWRLGQEGTSHAQYPD